MVSNTENLIPKTYLDREDWRDLNYYFISYSHKDREIVFDTLDKLYKNSINYWYDVELDPGDEWNERVEKEMENERCKGAVLFLSKNSLISNAVRKEITTMLKISEKRDFQIIPVIIGYETAKELIIEVANSNDTFYNDGMDLFQRITKKLWRPFDTAVDEIIKSSERKETRANCLPPDLDSLIIKGKRIFLCGKYPQEENGILRDIEWISICRLKEKYYFISKYCLDFTDYTAIDSVIEKIKSSISGTQNFEGIALINEKFIKEYTEKISVALPSNYADQNRKQFLRLFWVLQGDGKQGAPIVLYNANNCKIETNIQKDKINAGVRLILIMRDSNQKNENKAGGIQNV